MHEARTAPYLHCRKAQPPNPPSNLAKRFRQALCADANEERHVEKTTKDYTSGEQRLPPEPARKEPEGTMLGIPSQASAGREAKRSLAACPDGAFKGR